MVRNTQSLPKFYEIVKKMIGKARTKRILDVGSGPSSSRFFRQLFPKAEIIGINIDKKASDLIEVNIKQIVCDCQDMSIFEDNYFNVVFSDHVIQRLYYPEKFLRECYRVLKPNGTNIILTKNLASWYNRLSLLFGYQPPDCTFSREFKNLGAHRFIFSTTYQPTLFTIRALKELLKKTGFKILDCEVINPIFKNQPFRRLRYLMKILPKNWRETIILKAVSIKS